MKNLAHILTACLAAQLLFVVTARASVSTSSIEPKSSICATPDEDGPFEGWATPDEDGPFEGWATPDEDGPFEGW